MLISFYTLHYNTTAIYVTPGNPPLFAEDVFQKEYKGSTGQIFDSIVEECRIWERAGWYFIVNIGGPGLFYETPFPNPYFKSPFDTAIVIEKDKEYDMVRG